MESPSDLLTSKDCETILQNSLKQTSPKVTSCTIKSHSDRIEGFLGDHFLVTIEYVDKEGAQKSQRFFMKVLNGSSKLIFEISKSLNAYKKEEFFYTFLLNEFEKYGIDTSFAPKGYFCKPYLLVLEDLSQRNFIGFPNETQFLDLNHCKIGLITLAKFHAAGIRYEIAKSSEQNSPYCLAKEYSEMFQDLLFVEDNNVANEWFKKSVEGIFALVSVISEEYNINKEKFEKLLTQELYKIADISNQLSKFRGTILHGDIWFNNFLFKYENAIPSESILFDFQILKYGPPSIDVLHFLFANTRKKFRDNHFNELIEFYYRELQVLLPNDDLNVYLPKEQYLQLCNEMKIMLKLQCICDRCVTLQFGDALTTRPDDETLKINLFQRRSEKILSCYEGEPVFKEILSEDMIELYHMLCDSSFVVIQPGVL